MRVAGAVTIWAAKQDPDSAIYPIYEDMIAAAYLHDVLEDSDVKLGEIVAATNRAVGRYVEELTNASTGSKEPRAVRKAKDREKLRGASRQSQIIKMFDRIDNLQDLPSDDSFCMKYADESWDLADVLKNADADVHYELLTATIICHKRGMRDTESCLGCEKGAEVSNGFHKSGPYPGIPCLKVVSRDGTPKV